MSIGITLLNKLFCIVAEPRVGENKLFLGRLLNVTKDFSSDTQVPDDYLFKVRGKWERLVRKVEIALTGTGIEESGIELKDEYITSVLAKIYMMY